MRAYGDAGPPSRAALRRLVDIAMKEHSEVDNGRRRREVAAKVMWSLAGDLPGFEEASRALFQGEMPRFEVLIGDWPKDIRSYLHRLTNDRWDGTPPSKAATR
jgi:hypothetical protein